MNKKDIENTVADLKRRVENLERQNQPSQPSDVQVRLEAEQDAHQAALTSFQTKRDGSKNVSLNELPKEARAVPKHRLTLQDLKDQQEKDERAKKSKRW